MNTVPGKLLRLYVSEHDRYYGKPLYEAIVACCRELQVIGATVFRGLEGFGHTAEVHRPHLFTHDQPVVVHVVETLEKAARTISELQRMMPGGFIAVTDIEITVVSNGPSSPAEAAI